jgi:Ran GTPase-activating protein (RanGAP) involved in mRNA processing and transport
LRAILAGISKCSGVHSINLAENNIREELCANVVEALADSGVTVVDLSGNPLGDNSAAIIAEAVSQGAPFASLILSNCEIQDAGAVHLASVAATSDTLMALDLTGNPLGPSAARAFSQAETQRRVPLSLQLSEPGELPAVPGDGASGDSLELRGGISSLHQSLATLQERLAGQAHDVLELTRELDRTRAEHDAALRVRPLATHSLSEEFLCG